MKLEQLFEMPQLINAVDFSLGNKKQNHIQYNKVISDLSKREIYRFKEIYILYNIKSKLFLLDTNSKQILYFVQWKEVFHKFIGINAASQIAVWRTSEALPSTKIPSKVFFDALLAEYKAVISDVMQTQDGRNFWNKRIEEAFELGFHVYYINLLKSEGNLNRELIKIIDYDHFFDLSSEKDFWGVDKKHQNRKILITSEPLKDQSKTSRNA